MILFDATPLQSEHRLRGVGSYLRHLIQAIEALDDPKPHYLVSTVGLEHIEGLLPTDRLVKVFRPHKPGQVYWAYNEIALRAALLRSRPSVFFAPDFNGLIHNPFGKTVAVLHDLTALKLELARTTSHRQNLSLLLSDLRWRVYYRKLKAADHIIAISHSVKCDAEILLDIPENRITVIHLGVDHERFQPAKGEGVFANHPPYFLNIGGRNENKNQARILEAFARIPTELSDVRLYFAGPWREVDHDWLRSASSRLGVEDRVEHLGYVPDDDLPDLYSNALAFVFPSLEEGFGLPVLESMACGTPVITSNQSSLPEVAGGAALLINPLAVEGLAQAMRKLAIDKSRYTDLVAQGLSRAKEFTWARTAHRTLDIIEACQGKP